MFDFHKVQISLLSDMLATNPCDPSIHETHILQRQRKLISEKGGINAKIDKYLDALSISTEKGEDEVNMIWERLEELIGYKVPPEEREEHVTKGLKGLRETFKELNLKGTTIFFVDKKTGLPCIGDHMISGFLKAAAEAMCAAQDKKSGTMLQSKSHTKSIINQHARCVEKFLVFNQDIRKNEDGSPHYLQRSIRVMTQQGPRVSLVKSEVVETGAKLSFTLKVLKGSPLTKPILHTLFSYGELSGLGQWRNGGCGQFEATIL